MRPLTRIGALASALAFGMALATASHAMSREEYKAGKDRIAADYKSAKAGCATFSGNAKDICIAEAKGNEKVAKAELEAVYQPSSKHRYDVNVAKADAEYAVAKEKCDDKAGNDKKVCMKEAKAAETRAKADAKANLKTASADNAAAEDKREADYKVAKAKCDRLAGEAKEHCVDDAKARYGK